LVWPCSKVFRAAPARMCGVCRANRWRWVKPFGRIEEDPSYTGGALCCAEVTVRESYSQTVAESTCESLGVSVRIPTLPRSLMSGDRGVYFARRSLNGFAQLKSEAICSDFYISDYPNLNQLSVYALRG
jgi:hypothetical protein